MIIEIEAIFGLIKGGYCLVILLIFGTGLIVPKTDQCLSHLGFLQLSFCWHRASTEWAFEPHRITAGNSEFGFFARLIFRSQVDRDGANLASDTSG